MKTAQSRSTSTVLPWNRGIVIEAPQNLLMQNSYEALSDQRIERARKHYLYLGSGKRISDYYLDGSRGILGHDFNPSILAMKNALSKALLSAFPQKTIAQIRKILIRIFPGYYPLVFSHRLSALSFLEDNGAKEGLFWYPNLLSGKYDTVSKDIDKSRMVIPVLPFASAFSPQVILIPEQLQKTKKYSNGGNHSPFELLGLTAALKRLTQYLFWDDNSAIKALVSKRYKLRELTHHIEQKTEITGPWHIVSHYLYFTGESRDYGKIWKSLFTSGILLPDNPDQLLCLSSTNSIKEVERILSTKGD